MATRPIKIDIIGDDSRLKKTLKGANKKLAGFGQSVAKLGVTSGIAFAATATAVATKGLTAFAAFEKGMKEVMTLMPDAGATVFGEMSDQVKTFSKEFGVLPDKVIPALYQSISAGIPRENVFEFMRVAQQAAKGGVTDLETAVDGITSVVNAYGSEVMSATQASDALFTAVKLGKTDFGQLSKEVYKVAPIAAAVGIEFGAVAGALANLTAQGTPTAVAASQLKAAFAELAKAGSKSDKAFRDLAGKGLADFLAGGGTLEDALVMMKDGADDAGVSVLDLFSSIEAGQAVLALTADGGAALSATMAEMDASAGATQTAFETMDTGLASAFDRIKANLSVMAIEAGEFLAPIVTQAAKAILDGFEKMKPHLDAAREAVKAFATQFIERVTPAVKKFVEVAKKVIDWVRNFIEVNPKVVLAALGTVVAAVVIPAILGLVAAFFALFSPVILIVAALAALAGGAVYAYTHFETFRNIVDGVKDFFVNTVWPALQEVAAGIVTAFWAVVDFAQTTLWPALKVVGDAIVTAFWAVLRFFQEDFLPIATMVGEKLVTAYNAVKDALVGAFDWLNEHRDFTVLMAGAIGGLVAALVVWKTVTLAQAAATKIATVAQKALNLAQKMNPIGILVTAIAALIGMLVAAYFRFESVRNIVDAVWQKIQEWADWLWTYLAPALAAIWEAIVATFTAVLTFFQEDFIPLVTEVAETITAIWQAIADFFMDKFLPAAVAFVDALVAAFTAFADFFTEYVWPIVKTAFIGIASVLDNFWDVIKAMVNLVKALFSGDFKEVWVQLRTMIGEVIDLIVDLFIFLPGRILNAARPLIGKFALIVADFTKYLFNKILALIQAIPDQIVEFISGIAEDILNVGKDLGGWIIDGLINAIKAAAQAVLDAVKSIMPDVGGMVSGAVGSIKGGLGWIPGLQHGGVVTSPTLAMIGEGGPEAVVPLDRAGAMGATFNITVNAGLGTDGRQVGNQIVSALKQWERANGSLPLSVSAV